MENDNALFRQALSALRHDARNLLGGVQAVADRFERSGDDGSKKLIDHIADRVATLVRLTQRAELLHDIDSATFSDLTAADILAEAREQGAPAEMEFASGAERTFKADLRLSGLALAEVLSNAQLSGGAVELRAEEGAIIVEDAGNGLPRFARETLLTPFKGAKRPGGSSLGLPIADKAMRVQEGSLSITDRETGSGTRVVLRWS